jgi:putative membrane-bound dehydrogenase-like protein
VAEDAKVIFKTTGTWDYDHQIHAFVFGPEGKFYFNFGDAATSLTWPDGTVVRDMAGNEITNKGAPYRKGMVFRCDLDLATGRASNVETLGHNFRNNYEVAVDSFGAMWQSDNDDDGNRGVRINYVMEFGNYGYTDEMTGAGWRTKRLNMETDTPQQHWYQNDPGVVPNLLGTGAGSPTGILVNEGDGLGAAFKNEMIHCDAGPRTTRAYPVQKAGAGYTATMVDVLTSSDSWYRVADLAIAPDGALLVADWYDPGVGGHNMGDHEAGTIRGRIYRVTAGKLAMPKIDVSTAAGAVQALSSPNLAARALGWRALHAMGAKAEPVLNEMLKSPDARLRARALGVLAHSKTAAMAALRAGLTDPDEDVRIAAIRFATTLERSKVIDTTPLDSDQALVGKLLRDTPGVRRQIALSLYRSHKIEKLWAALAMQHDGRDRWYLEALGIGAIGNEDICFDTWLAMVGEKWNTPAGRDIIWRMRSAKAADYLAKIIEGRDVAAAEKPRFVRAFDFLPAGESKTKALVELATAGKVGEDLAREALVRLKGSHDASVQTALKTALDKAKGTPQFIELVRDFGAKGHGAALLETALKLGNDPLAGEAVRLVLAEQDADAVIRRALESSAAPVLSLLVTSGSKRALEAVAAFAGGADGAMPELRRSAVAALARTQAGAEQLLALARAGKLDEPLKLSAASALAAVQYASLKDQIAEVFPMPGALGGRPLPSIAELVKMKGDAARGKAVAERAEATCITCHRIGNVGVDFGPALSEIGAKLPKEALYDAIINPNNGVSMGFETWQFALRDGGAALGLIRSETPQEVTLALPGGATQKIARDNIAKREKQTTSMMPSGLNQALSQQDLIDLVEYLASLKAK